MFSFISNWLKREDDNFLTNVQDATKRGAYLSQLYRVRRTTLVALCFGFLLAVLSIFSSLGPTVIIGVMITTAISFVDTDSKIKMILLYESKTASTSTQAENEQ